MRAARFLASSSLVHEALYLPSSATIIGVRMLGMDQIEFIVDDPALPEADHPHDAMPIMTRESLRFDWGLK